MNRELIKYNSVFKDIFEISDTELEVLAYKKHTDWNSMAHIALIAALEESFNINFETDDIFSFNSYINGKEILKSKFGIEL